MRQYFLCGTAGLILVLSMNTVNACTGVTLKSKDGAVVRGRTMEFAQPMDSHILVIPRNYEFAGIGPSKKTGLKWKTKFALAGANFAGQPYVTDGLNEKGLSGGIFYFPGITGYQTCGRQQESAALAPWQLLTWILTSFATVEEVKKALPGIVVYNAVFDNWGSDMPLHYIVTDAAGAGIVIEYIGGKLNIHNNPSGVLTNAPDFQWHLTNLRNYLKMSPQGVKPISIHSLKISPLGQGSGMLGIPGDYTPPSRFVRAFFFAAASIQRKNAFETAMQIFHILNNFDIPWGTVRSAENEVTALEHTQWISVCDLKNKFFYYRTENNSRIRVLKLLDCNLDSDKIIKLKMESPEKAEDITARLK
ncbi:MAG: choloylglycine hydrolase family protein [Victivallales bacterium]